MAVSSGFFNASEQSGNRDRVYSAEDFGAIFDGIISDGIFEKYPDSVYDSETYTWSPFKVIPSENASVGHLEVIVRPGRAWFDKTWTLNDADVTVNLDSRDASKHRIDGIYIKVDKDERQNSIYVAKGDEASTAPSLKPPTDVPGHVTHYLIATIYVTANQNVDSQITLAEITNMIGLDGGAPYVESNVTDPSITTSTILKNLENQFDSYQSKYTDEFVDWFESIKDTKGTVTADQIVEIAELVANTYSTDYLSGGYPYANDDCLYLSSSKDVLPPVIINFGFVTGSMYPNRFANELTVHTETLQTGE